MANMVSIDSIRPDPNQPRKVFDKGHIQGLSRSLEMEGMINPIEIDGNGMIITGECRWRAAVILGWTEVPITQNPHSFNEYERLRHQMAENIHQSGSSYDTMMNPLDTAHGYENLLKLGGKWSPGDQQTQKDKGIRELAREIGVEHQTIMEYLSLLEEPQVVQKAIQQGLPRTYIREANRFPEELRSAIKQKIVKGDYPNRESITQERALAVKIPELVPSELERVKAQESIATNRILNGIAKLALALESLPMSEVDVREKGIVKKQLEWLLGEVEKYLS